MADNYTFKDAGALVATHASKELSAGVHASKHIEVDDTGALVVKAEDAAHNSGDKGIMALAVRKDSAAALAGTDGDYTPLIVDSSGRLHVTSVAEDSDTLLGAVTETAPANDTASSGLNGRLQRIAQRLTSLITLLPASLGQKTMANSIAVTLASDQTAITTGATDDAAADGQIYASAGLYQAPSSVDSVDNGDLGRLRMSARRGIISVADCQSLVLVEATPVPSGSDLFGVGAAALAAADFAIRDTTQHQFTIPMAISGWRHLNISVYTATAFDQILNVKLFGGGSSYSFWSTLLNFNIPASAMVFGIGGGSVGIGGIAGDATAALSAYYGCDAIPSGWPYLQLAIQASVAPSSGTLVIHLSRSS